MQAVENWNMEIKKISVIIPTLNESGLLANTLTAVRQTSTLVPIEIIVVDGGSQDSTVEVAQAGADKILKAPDSSRGAQMHQGALDGSGDVFLFLHGDTCLPENWQACLIAAYRHVPVPVATAFRLGFNHDAWYYRMFAWGANARSGLFGIAHGDQALSVGRQPYLNSGGFPSVALMEEYFLGPALRAQGKVVLLDAVVTTSARRYEENGPFFNVIRNQFLTLLFYMGVSTKTLARFYQWSRKRKPEKPQ